MSEYSKDNQKETVVPAHIEAALIISLKEARKLMGVDARTLSDDELMLEIWYLMDVASDLLKSFHVSDEKQL